MIETKIIEHGGYTQGKLTMNLSNLLREKGFETRYVDGENVTESSGRFFILTPGKVSNGKVSPTYFIGDVEISSNQITVYGKEYLEALEDVLHKLPENKMSLILYQDEPIIGLSRPLKDKTKVNNFRTKFTGIICLKKTRTKEETSGLLIKCGLANDEDSAKVAIEELCRRSADYKVGLTHVYTLKLESVGDKFRIRCGKYEYVTW